MNITIRLANRRIHFTVRCEKKLNVHVCERISYVEAQNYPSVTIPAGGYFVDGMRWKNYVERYSKMHHAFADYAEAIRKYVIQHSIRIDGTMHQKSTDGALLMSDGTAIYMQFRAWGDLMAAIWSTYDHENYNCANFDFGGVSVPSRWFAKLRRANRKYMKSIQN